MADSAAMPAAMTGQASFRIAGLARRQRRTSIVMAIATRTSPATEVIEIEHVPGIGVAPERDRAVGALGAVRRRPRVEQRPEQRRHGEHDAGDDREHALHPGLELPRGIGEYERRERHPDEVAEEEPDREQPVVARLLERSEEPDVAGRGEVDPRPVLGAERQRDQAAHDERDARRDRQADLGPVGLRRRADELRAAGGASCRATSGSPDGTAGRGVDGREEHRSQGRLEDEEGDSEDDEDAVHGRSAATRSPESSPLATKPHAHDEETSSP